MQKTKDISEAIASTLRSYGHVVAADIVIQLEQQRAELLEALKGVKDAFCNPESGEIDKRLAVQDMNKALTKAKAPE